MRSIVIVLPILLLFLVIVVAIPVMIGTYVYRDASRRGMNAALWTLVAVFAPSLIGFIIYLLVRGSHSDLKCPRCDATVREDYIVCPKCGAKLQPTCANCGGAIQRDWKVCPRCANPLSESFQDVSVPNPPKDNALSKILTVIILIPVLLLVFMIAGAILFMAVPSQGSSTTVGEVPLSKLYDLESSQELEEVKAWLKTIEGEENTAYVLQYVSSVSENSKDKEYHYLLYIPCMEGSQLDSFGADSGWFQNTFVVEFYDGGDEEASVYAIVCSYDEEMDLEVRYNGEELECKITEVDFEPTGVLFGFDEM